MEMTPLSCGLAAAVPPLVAWRVDALVHRLRWDSGIDAERAGGRWNPKGMRVVYCSFDPGQHGAWLHAGIPSAGQQSWGGDLLARHPFVVFPSVLSKQSWNLAFCPTVAAGHYTLREQDRLVIDGRLNPP